MLKIINGLSSPIGQATRSKPPACMGHLLICQVTKCAVTVERFPQLCPHDPLSWIAFQRADRLIPIPKPHAKKIIAGCEHTSTQSPAAKSGQLCLTKAVPILQANGQLCLLLDSALNCLDPWVSVGPTDGARHLSIYLLLPEFHLHIPNGLCGAFSASLTSSVCELGHLSRFVLNLGAFQMHLRGTFFSC